MSETARLFDILNHGVANNLFSAAQLVVSDPDKILVSFAVGKTRKPDEPRSFYHPSLDITENTLFDVASLTKPLATAALMMKAVDENMIRLEQKLVSIPNIQFPSWLLGDTIKQLLSHQTMLPAWADFHGSIPRVEDYRQARSYVERAICQMAPREDGKTWTYSDLGYILLGFILEEIYQDTLDNLFIEKITAPLGLQYQICYLPLHHCMQKLIAATCPYSNGYIQGHPDDSNARALCHCAGHAGVFASAKSVDFYVRHLINHDFPCQPETIETFLNYHHPDTPFALGWDRPTSEDSLSGRKPGDPVLGHLGFTGCSVWYDLETKRIITLLTNRTHCNDVPASIGGLRREIHKIAWEMA